MDVFVWLENSTVGAYINQSSSIFFAYPGILLVHTFGLTLLVGTNVVIGLRILGFAPRIPVTELRRLFPLMWIGLIFSVSSGLLLLTAKATTMIVNPAFFIKMLAIGLAVTAVYGLRNRVIQDPLLDKRPIPFSGKVLAFASLALWLIAITAGRMMAYVGEAAHFGALILK